MQNGAGGIADALGLAEDFAGSDKVAVILGDNIFEDDFSESIKNFKSGGHVFAKKVQDPQRFGVVKFDEQMKVVQIEEKPKTYISDYAITGLYLYDNRIAEIAKQVKPSARGELEITELHNWYLKAGELKVDVVEGEWFDAGTFDSLFKASELAYKKATTNEQ